MDKLEKKGWAIGILGVLLFLLFPPILYGIPAVLVGLGAGIVIVKR